MTNSVNTSIISFTFGYEPLEILLTPDFVLRFSLNKTKKRTAQTLSRDTKSKTNNNSSPKLKSRNNETVSKTEMKKGFNKSSSCSENQSPKLTDSLNTRKGQRKTPKNTSTRKENANNVTGQLSQAGLETSRHEGVSVITDKTLALSESNMSSSKSSSAQESHLVLADVSHSKSSTELKEVLTKESGSSCSSNNLAGSLEMTEGPKKITLPTDDSSRIQCVDQHSYQDFETFSEEVSVNKSNSLFEMSPNGVGSNQNFQVDKVASKSSTELEEGSLVSSSCDWNDSSKLTSQQRKKPINTSTRRQSDDLVCENYQTALGSSKTNKVISETRTKSLPEDNSSCNVAKFLYQPENLFVGETGSKKSTTSGKGSEMSKMSHEKEITKLADTGMTSKGQQTCTNDASTRNADSAGHKNSLVNLKTSNLDSAILIASTKSFSEKKGKSPINSVRPTTLPSQTASARENLNLQRHK